MVDLAWACAVLKCRDVSLLAGIADMGAPLRLQRATPGHPVSQLIAAASSRPGARLRGTSRVNVDLLTDLTFQLHPRLAPLTCRLLQSLIWTCNACAGETWVQDLRPQEAARLVWSYAALGYRPAGFLDRLAARAPVSRPPSLNILCTRSGCARRLLLFTVTTKASGLWAQAATSPHVDVRHTVRMRGLKTDNAARVAVLAQVTALQHADLTRMLWGFARLRHHPGLLLAAAAREVRERLPAYPPTLLGWLAWSFRQFETLDEFGRFQDAGLTRAISRQLALHRVRGQQQSQSSDLEW
jgi:hypothetical protein